MDSQKLTDAYWTLFTCRESTEIWIRLAGSSSTLSKPRGQLRFAACRVGGRRGFHLSDRYICPSTFYSQVHHPLTHAFAGRNLPDQSPSSHHCIQAIKPKSETAREACKPGGASVAKCSNMFQRQGMKRSTTVPTPRAAFIGKIRVWGWPGSCS